MAQELCDLGPVTNSLVLDFLRYRKNTFPVQTVDVYEVLSEPLVHN